MNKGCVNLMILASVCVVVFAGGAVVEVLAETKNMNEPVPAINKAKPSRPQSEQGHKPARLRDKTSGNSGVLEHQTEVVQNLGQKTSTESKSPRAKSHRHVKVDKKVRPKALVQSRTDLMYHGLLEDAQRYDPRPNSRMAAVSSPQTQDLTHDHFQELDRNQDGMIDPVEKAFGRLDLDHDLPTSQR